MIAQPSIDGLRRDRHATMVLRWALALGLVIRALIFSQTGALGTGIVDEQHYRAIASNIYDHHEYAAAHGEPTSIRPPLYPALVAGIWTLSGPQQLQAVRLVQIALALISAWLVYAIGMRTFGYVTACYAAAVCWLYPSLIFFNFLILTETLFTCLLLAFVLFSVRLVQEGKQRDALACGTVLALAALTRSVLWPVPLVLCPLLLMLLRTSWSQRLRCSALLLIGYVVVIAPWAVRNTRLQETLTVVDTMGGINLRMGNYEYTPEDRMWDAVSITGERSWVRGFPIEAGINPTEGRKDKWAQRQAVLYMRSHPGQTARRGLIKFADFWGLEREFIAGVQGGLFAPPQWFTVAATVMIISGYVLVVLTAAAGIWLAAPQDWRLHLLLLFPVTITVAAHTLVFGHSRYHLPLMPLLGLYSAHFVATRQPLLLMRRQPAFVGAAATAMLLASIWIRQIVFVDAGRLSALLQRLG